MIIFPQGVWQGFLLGFGGSTPKKEKRLQLLHHQGTYSSALGMYVVGMYVVRYK